MDERDGIYRKKIIDYGDPLEIESIPLTNRSRLFFRLFKRNGIYAVDVRRSYLIPSTKEYCFSRRGLCFDVSFWLQTAIPTVQRLCAIAQALLPQQEPQNEAVSDEEGVND